MSGKDVSTPAELAGVSADRTIQENIAAIKTFKDL